MRRGFKPQVYEVEAIIDESIMNYEMHYLIKWKNLGHQHDTWQPVSNLKSIASYIKHWIHERERINQFKKNQKTQSFKSIKSYLYNGQFLSKKKGKYAKYGQQILSKKKTWQKYLDREENFIDIEESEGYEDPQEQFVRKNQRTIDQVFNKSASSNQKGEEDIYQEEEEQQHETTAEKNNKDETIENNNNNKNQIKQPQKMESEEPIQEKKQLKETKAKPTKNVEMKNQDPAKFQVIGKIDMKHIDKIIRSFVKGTTKILQIKMNDGKVFHAKQEDVKKANPAKLIEYYQQIGEKF